MKKCRSVLTLNKCQSGRSQTLGHTHLEGECLEIPDKLLTPTVPSSTQHNVHIHLTYLPIPLLSLGWRIEPL